MLKNVVLVANTLVHHPALIVAAVVLLAGTHAFIYCNIKSWR